ncbi:UBX domain-containing protein [Paracoccidioides lutzii Pb01]|uniref:UBX domain-containing protein n=1 Tax=Paracoccidioides lutzii (strain ATCC MYA-826 / Pb01) TaxID=502779 RepID=C1HE24_PARBA|nr:UBX domain-containing protein [Paracoccidioides lutzii Pb01]EEH40564.1 UBX domain-containing protein [Paracoccidioides lutzii Pb01]
MADAAVAGFTEITGSTPEVASHYLQLTDGNLEIAMQLYFENGSADIHQEPSVQPAPPHPAPAPALSSTRPSHPSGYQDVHGVVHLDSDGDDDDGNYNNRNNDNNMNEIEEVEVVNIPVRTSQQQSASTSRPPPSNTTFDDDEALARRLQEEFYAGAEGLNAVDADGVRAPMARTTETLVDPSADSGFDDASLEEAVLRQMRARQHARAGNYVHGANIDLSIQVGRPGIFNQRPVSFSIWNQDDPASHRAALLHATGGASNTSSKSGMLAEMYRPPFEIISKLPWDLARDEGREKMRWLLVNIQDPAVFDCQVLNRDLWKNPGVMETVKEHFIFLQYLKDDPRGSQYIQYYFPGVDVQEEYPHIAIVDPRTGEQVKTWSGPPVIKPADFLMQLHEFLDRYSLDNSVRNPVARRKPDVRKERKIESMSEDEMLEMALKNSLETENPSRREDPDDLTRSIGDVSVKGKGKGKEKGQTFSLDPDDIDMDSNGPGKTEDEDGNDANSSLPNSTFVSIPSDRSHTEPDPDPATVTRIQFRHPTGRVIRRFSLSDPVRRIYEWLKASPLEGKEGVEFELVAMGQNLIGLLDVSVEDAGLKNGTVMVGFVED